ncbi:hypothetical protein NQ317_011703 [Molorchus minor]|uniref:Uncharacterized protein n=1 Tax=Molorchus minor TaxID=1323400 RepID=A0ABQ9JSG5_9CUCU|nr:hypothetical protein NQ317_011703 [Molorchus minor]
MSERLDKGSPLEHHPMRGFFHRSLVSNIICQWCDSLHQIPEISQKHLEDAIILNVIIGKQVFPKILSASSEPGNTTRKACQAHLELAELVEILARLLVMRKSDTQSFIIKRVIELRVIGTLDLCKRVKTTPYF